MFPQLRAGASGVGFTVSVADVAVRAAWSARIPADVAQRLTVHPHVEVRRAVTANETTPTPLLTALDTVWAVQSSLTIPTSGWPKRPRPTHCCPPRDGEPARRG